MNRNELLLNLSSLVLSIALSYSSYAQENPHERFEDLLSSPSQDSTDAVGLAMTHILNGVKESEAYFQRIVEYIHIYYGADRVDAFITDLADDPLIKGHPGEAQLGSVKRFRRLFFKNWLTFLKKISQFEDSQPQSNPLLNKALQNFWKLPKKYRTRHLTFEHSFDAGSTTKNYLHMFRFLASFAPEKPPRIVPHPDSYRARPLRLLLTLNDQTLVPKYLDSAKKPIDNAHIIRVSKFIGRHFDAGLLQGIDLKWSATLAKAASVRSNLGPGGHLAATLSAIVQATALRDHPDWEFDKETDNLEVAPREFEMRVRFDENDCGVSTDSEDSLGLNVFMSTIKQEWRYSPPFRPSGRWLNLVLQGDLPHRDLGFRELVFELTTPGVPVVMNRTVTLRPNMKTVDSILANPVFLQDPYLFNYDSFQAGTLSFQIEGERHRMHASRSGWRRFFKRLALDTNEDRNIYEQIVFEYWKQHGNQQRSGSLFQIGESALRFINNNSKHKKTSYFIDANPHLSVGFGSEKEWRIWTKVLSKKDPSTSTRDFARTFFEACRNMFSIYRPASK